MPTFDSTSIIATLEGEATLRANRQMQAPMLPHGLSRVQLGILKEVFEAGGEIGGAELVGKVFGKHVPFMKTEHIYEECLDMAREWVFRYPLLDAEGSGSPYTSTVYEPWENKFSLTEVGRLMRDVCDDAPPEFPHLWVNGFSGGRASIPPHTLDGIIDAITLLLKSPGISDIELVPVIGAPDYPSGCIVDSGEKSMAHIHTNKSSKVILQAKTEIIRTENGYEMVLTGLPEGVTPESIIEKILAHERDIPGLRRVVNETTDAARVVLHLAGTVDNSSLTRMILGEIGCQKEIPCKMVTVNGQGLKEALSFGDMLKRYIDARCQYLAARVGGASAASRVLSEIKEIKRLYGKDRSSTAVVLKDIAVENSNDPMVVLVSAKGMVRRVPASAWGQQSRAGKGVDCIPIQASKIDQDSLSMISTGAANSTIVMATTRGRVFFRVMGVIPEGTKDSLGEPLGDYLGTEDDEGVTSMSEFKKITEENLMVVVTSQGKIKGLSMSKFTGVKKAGRAAISLGEGDRVVSVLDVPPESAIAILTSRGTLVRLVSTGIGESAPTTKGINAMLLSPGESIVSACVLPIGDEALLLTNNANGNGKITRIGEFPLQGLGSSGHLAMKSEQTSALSCFVIKMTDELVAGSKEGRVLRFPVKDMPITGRGGIGVILQKLASTGDALIGVGIVTSSEEVDEEIKPEKETPPPAVIVESVNEATIPEAKETPHAPLAPPLSGPVSEPSHPIHPSPSTDAEEATL